MVFFTNVVVSVAPKAQAKLTDKSLDNVALQTATTGIEAYLEMQDPGEVFRTYDVMLQNPAILQIDVASYQLLLTNWATFIAANPQYAATNPGNPWPDSEVTITASSGMGSYTGQKYRVQGRGDVHDDGLRADHATLLLDQLTFPL